MLQKVPVLSSNLAFAPHTVMHYVCEYAQAHAHPLTTISTIRCSINAKGVIWNGMVNRLQLLSMKLQIFSVIYLFYLVFLIYYLGKKCHDCNHPPRRRPVEHVSYFANWGCLHPFSQTLFTWKVLQIINTANEPINPEIIVDL